MLGVLQRLPTHFQPCATGSPDASRSPNTNDPLRTNQGILEARTMQRHLALLMLLCAHLVSCSEQYRVLAAASAGRLVFVVDPNSQPAPACLRSVSVTAEGRSRARAEEGDDSDMVGYGTFWSEEDGYDKQCESRFPLPYGAPLKGRRVRDVGNVKPKQLLRNVVYEISTTTGFTAYGSGRFLIRAGGKIENLAPR